MLQQTLIAALVCAWAGTATAQSVGVVKNPIGGLSFTTQESQEVTSFRRLHEAEQKVIAQTCQEYAFSLRDRLRWGPVQSEEAVWNCFMRGEYEYVLNYRFTSPYLQAVLRNQ